MNNYQAPTSMINIQESDALKTNDRFQVECEVNKSDKNIKTQDAATIQKIDFLFTQIKQANVDTEALVMDIYSLSLANVYKTSIIRYFDHNFPFLPFLNIILSPPSPECQSYAFICLGSACHAESFPFEKFANENALTFFCQALCSEDPIIVDSSLQLLSEITKKSIESRNFLLQNSIIPKLKSMKLTFSVAELLESLCSLFPPPPPEFIPDITQFIEVLIDGSETSIFELGFSSLLSLLTNHAEGVYADQFQTYLVPIFLSETTSLVPLALKILMLVHNPQPDFAITLLKILAGTDFPNLSNNPTVLFLIAQSFAHFQPIWRPIIQDQPFVLLKDKIGNSRFKVDIEIVQTMILYYDQSHLDDLVFFNTLVRFSDTIEIGCKCMEQILLMIQSGPRQDIFEKMLDKLEQSTDTFVTLSNGEDEDMAIRAESILNEIEKAKAIV